MSYLRINGVEIPVAAGQSGFNVVIIDGDRTTQNNRQVIRRRRARNDWDFTTTKVPPREADFIEALVSGQGHRASFDVDLWTTRGRTPLSSSGAGITNVSPPPRFGANRLILAGGSPSVVWDFNAPAESSAFLSDRWFLQCWRSSGTTLASWNFWQARSDGALFLNGVRDDTLDSTWFSVAEGKLTIRPGTSPACVAVDDLSIIFAEPSDEQAIMAAQWQMDDHAWSDMPHVTADGDFCERVGTYTPTCEAEQSIGQFSLGAAWAAGVSWRNNTRAVQFSLSPRDALPTSIIRKPSLWLTMNSPSNFSSSIPVDAATPVHTTANLNVPTIEADGQVGTAIRFVNAAVTASPSTDFDRSEALPFSGCAWIWPTAPVSGSTRSTIIGKTRPGFNAGWSMDIETNANGTLASLRADVTNAAGTAGRFARTAAAALLTYGWNHVAWVYDGSSSAAGWAFYINGERYASSIITDTAPGSLVSVILPTFGRSDNVGGSRQFIGATDEAGWWPVELTQAEVREIYRLGALQRGIMWGA